jgi:serpin B
MDSETHMAENGLATDLHLSRRAVLLGLIGALAATQVAACGGSSGDAPPLLRDDLARDQVDAHAPIASASAGVAAFGHQLCLASAAPGGNWVASPLSIACAFAMARVGAGGATASQIDHVLGLPATGRDAAFNAITRQLGTVDVPPARSTTDHKPGQSPASPVICLGNALFVQKGQQIGAAFLRTLATQYGTGARTVDFTSGTALAQINAWVRQQTADRIPELFDNLAAETRLVLANAVYLKADWALPFDEGPTTRESFTRAGGATTTVDMMATDGRFRYAAGPGWQAVELRYAKSDLAMWIMLPAGGGSPADMLDPRLLSTVSNALATTDVNLAIPRWDFATDVDLGTVLPRLGLTAPFRRDADFAGISPGLFISQAVHRANITVAEWGTEAAAATGLTFEMSGRTPAQVTLRADRPFAFTIVGGPLRVPVFMGTVADPSAT